MTILQDEEARPVTAGPGFLPRTCAPEGSRRSRLPDGTR
jgi:hypothetical protein